jgi:hypothetical protein
MPLIPFVKSLLLEIPRLVSAFLNPQLLVSEETLTIFGIGDHGGLVWTVGMGWKEKDRFNV